MLDLAAAEFGLEQKGVATGDARPGSDAFDDLDATTAAGAGAYRLRTKACRRADEDNVATLERLYGLGGHYEGGGSGRPGPGADPNSDIFARNQTGIGSRRKHDRSGAIFKIGRWRYGQHPGRDLAFGRLDTSRVARSDAAGVFCRYRCFDLDFVRIGDSEKFVLRRDIGTENRRRARDPAADWRADRNETSRHARRGGGLSGTIGFGYGLIIFGAHRSRSARAVTRSSNSWRSRS